MAKKSQINKPTKPITKAAEVAPKLEKKPIPPSDFWTKYVIAFLVFAVLIAILYGASLKYGYVLDDSIVLSENKYVKKGFGGIKDILGTESMQGYFGEKKELLEGARYRPLSIVTFAIENQFFGNKPIVGHIGNLLFYLIASIVLFRVLLQLFPPKENQPWYTSIPFIATLLFVLHPLHTEVVANIKGRDEILTMLGAFVAMYYVIKHADYGGTKYRIIAGISFFLALLAKENAITFLAVIPVSLYFFRNASFGKMFYETIPLFVATFFYIIIRYSVIGYLLSNGKPVLDIMNNPFADMTLGGRLATIFYTLLLYLKLMIFPHPLTHDYYPYQIPKMTWSDIASIISLLIYIALGIIALKGWKKKTMWSYAILFYLFTLSIVSNLFVSVGTFMNERFIFISSVAFCLLLAWLLVEKIPEWMKSVPKVAGISLVSLIILSIFSLGFAVKTVTRVPVWKNALTLNTAAVTVSPNSARANLFMGTALFEEYKIEKNPDKQKEIVYRSGFYVKRATEILPTYGSALHMYSGIIAEYYKYDNNLDSLLNGFEKLLQKRNLLTIIDKKTGAVYIDQYIDYLKGRPDAMQKMPGFFHRVIQNFVAQKDNTNARKYLNMAVSIFPGDPTLAQDRIQLGQ